MTKALKLLTLAALTATLCALTAAAQDAPAQTNAPAAPEWVAVSPAGEGFGARMPKQPVSVAQRVRADGLSAEGIRYAAAPDDRTTFVVWSMKGSRAAGPLGAGGPAVAYLPGGAAYLDEVAELAWELLVAPEFERLEREKVSPRRMVEMDIGMTYGHEFALSGLPAREYSVRLEKERGLVYVCAEGARVYVVAAVGADARDARLKQFVDSFALKSAAARPAVVVVDDTRFGLGPGRGNSAGGTAAAGNTGGTAAGNTGGGAAVNGGGGGMLADGGADRAPVDYNKPFRVSELTKRAVITAKPEPAFTEQARKFNVTGVVRLRAILHSSGTVRNITVVKWLPHGLTATAVGAAAQIRFTPAEKDGRQVSQYVTLEYNFNIY